MDSYDTQANEIYSDLIKTCGATEERRDDFVHTVARWLRRGTHSECRFNGQLGFGGKFWTDPNGYRVSCYPEDRTKERDQMIQAANDLLARVHMPEPSC